MKKTFRDIINSHNLASYFKSNEAITFALSNDIYDSLCQFSNLFHDNDALFECMGVFCRECPFKSYNQALLKELLYPIKGNQLLPEPNVSEIGDINKYFPTIIEL